MLSKKVGEDETTYSYDVNNRLIQSTNNGVITDYTYDNNGNLLREEKGTEYTNYIYDGFNKLKEVNKSNGSWMYNEYSALGLRISTEENGVRAEFIFDRGSIITEVDSNNELIARSIRGLGLVAQKDNRNVLSYYLHNAHGDVTNLVDENGQVLNSYEYDAFGNMLNHAEKVVNRFMYAGEQFDRTTGHYYLRARYYAPNIGRFTQEDTYRGDGLNLYGYVHNNPVRYVDPSGHWLHIVAGAFIGGVVNATVTAVSAVVMGEEIDVGEVAGAFTSGTLTGGLAAATGGASLALSPVIDSTVHNVVAEGTRTIVKGEDFNVKKTMVEIVEDSALNWAGGKFGDLILSTKPAKKVVKKVGDFFGDKLSGSITKAGKKKVNRVANEKFGKGINDLYKNQLKDLTGEFDDIGIYDNIGKNALRNKFDDYANETFVENVGKSISENDIFGTIVENLFKVPIENYIDKCFPVLAN